MLAHRVIPVVLYRGHQALKGTRFQSWRSIGHVMQQAEVYASRKVDEIIFLDIGATPEGRGPDLKLVEQITAKCFSPVTVGGGVRSVQDVRDLLKAGADKVSICTRATRVLQESASVVGSQALVAAIDVPKSRPRWEREDATEYARCLAGFGAGEILLTSIERDGTMDGYDLELVRTVSAAVDIPVIANGGCGSPDDMLQAIEVGASACAAGAMFAWTDTTPRQCAEYLNEHDVEARC